MVKAGSRVSPRPGHLDNRQIKSILTDPEKDRGRKANALYFSTLFPAFEQEAP